MNIPTLPNYPEITAPPAEWRRLLEPLCLQQLTDAHWEATREWLKLGTDHPLAPQWEAIRGVMMELIHALVRRQREESQAALETVRLINELRLAEGDAVTILCDNPEFNGQPNCAVICNAYWTDYRDQRFAADSLLDCLRDAAEAKRFNDSRVAEDDADGDEVIGVALASEEESRS